MRHFNPRAPCGARLHAIPPEISHARFQPTRPLRGATSFGHGQAQPEGFQPTRPLRGATELLPPRAHVGLISTHAPLAGRDCSGWSFAAMLIISTHAPLAGRDWRFHPLPPKPNIFQPTRPLRGATGRGRGCISAARHFNPRAPCGARPKGCVSLYTVDGFQPTRPLRGATTDTCSPQGRSARISTHAPLAGRDPRYRTQSRNRRNFNPRAPCGARPAR